MLPPKTFSASPAEAALDQSLELIIPEHLRPRSLGGLPSGLQTGRTRGAGRPTLTKALTASGETIYVEMTFAVISDSEGRLSRLVAVARPARETRNLTVNLNSARRDSVNQEILPPHP